MPEAANPMNNMISAMLFGPDTQAKLMQAQQQQALADAILSEGIKPVSTDNRQIGGVGYAISPLEGLAKIADVISGKYQQKKAIDAYKDIYSGASSPDGQASMGQKLGNMLGTGQNLSPLAQMEILNGNRAVAEMVRPTEQQKNFGDQMPQYIQNELGKGYYSANPGQAALQSAVGTTAAGALPYGTMPQGAPQAGGAGAPQIPVDGPLQLPPIPSPQTMPSQADALQQYRQQNNMPTPPIDTQRQGMGLPVGQASNLPMPPDPQQIAQNMPQGQPQIPQVPASALAGPPTMPNPQGMSADQYKAALEVAKETQKARALAPIKAAEAGATAAATKGGDNLADAQKTYTVAAGNLPRAMQRFNQLREAAKNASYGGGVSEEEPGSMVGDYARNYARTGIGQALEPGRATANQIIDQATKQGVLSELGPQLAGLRGNKFLESIASGASGLNPADPSETKINAINGLQDQYISSLKSLAEQRRSYGDKTAPTDMDLAKLISQNAQAGSKISVVDPKGNLGRVDAMHLPDLIQAGGQLR